MAGSVLYESSERLGAEAPLRALNADLERRLQECTAQLARARAELEQFIYVAAHDLQEPLRGVAGYAQLLASRYGGQLDVDAQQFISRIEDGLTRMQTLIDDLLTFSRVDARGREFEPTNCEGVLEVTLSNLQMSLAASGTLITHDPLPTVMADRVQLGQVLQHLIDNAIKFRGERAPRVHISAHDGGLDWVFTVRDNGIGIAQEFSERIFNMFQRLHSRRKYPGTGSGLAISKKIVERHGGRMWVESNREEGSTFLFTLPKREEPAAES